MLMMGEMIYVITAFIFISGKLVFSKPDERCILF